MHFNLSMELYVTEKKGGGRTEGARGGSGGRWKGGISSEHFSASLMQMLKKKKRKMHTIGYAEIQHLQARA